MKSAHWIILLCSAAGLVFVATLAGNLVGGRGTKNTTAKPVGSQAKLTFADAVTDYPVNPPPVDLEVAELHKHDFWFKNENAETLPVGVFNKTCQCTNVLVWIAPADWKDVPKPEERDQAIADLEKVVQPIDLLNWEAETSVPAGAVGAIRLTWKGAHLGLKTLAATLWMAEKGPGPTQVFNIRTVFISPIRAFPETDAGDDITAEKLPLTVRVPCWSSTRPKFSLEAKAVQSRLNEKSNPFVVGKPVPMTEEDLERLRKEDEQAALRKAPLHGVVLSGYWVPLTLNKVSEDETTAFDFGPFRQHLELRTEGSDPVMVAVHGVIQGDLTPVDTGSIPVRFGPFDRTTEVRRLVVLESEPDVTRLELDRDRTANFLDVEFPKEPDVIGGRKTWNLYVKWVPDRMAGGVFPRDEDEYRDSAVYVRPVYAKPNAGKSSYLRIPAMGTADPPR